MFRSTRGVVIDAGHGGKDPGASGNGIIEKNLTLDISKYIYNRLKSLGVPVVMTRTTDETLEQNARVSRVLDAFGNSKDVIVISNHINAGGGEGVEVIYPLRQTDKFAKTIFDNVVSAGQKGRKYYQLRLPSNPRKDCYYMLRETPNTNAAIIEYGFLDNSKDAEKLKSNYKDYAEAVVRSIMEYSGLPYKAPTGGDFYTVQKGDTLWGIATKFGITVAKLKELNNKTDNSINVGDTLKVKETEEIIVPSGYTTYIVQKGDSLWKIANEYGVTVEDIKNANNLSSNLLTLNQELLIPINDELIIMDNNDDLLTYIVEKGDNLYSIANKYGTTVNEIKSLNNLSSNILSIGQTLLIPNSTKTYTVQSGDSLYSISKKYNTTVDKIKNLNNLNSNLLSIGQVLKIPNN